MGGPQLAARRTLLARSHQRAKEDQRIVAGPAHHRRGKAALADHRMWRRDHLAKGVWGPPEFSGEWQGWDLDTSDSRYPQVSVLSAKLGSTWQIRISAFTGRDIHANIHMRFSKNPPILR